MIKDVITKVVPANEDVSCFNFPVIYPDETIFSYVKRFVTANCLKTPIDVIGMIQKKDTTRMFTLHTDFGGIDFDKMFQFEDGTKFSSAMNIFLLLNLFMKKKSIKLYSDYKNPVHDIVAIRSCPLCDKEDLDKFGTTYYHLSHGIPGVTVCHKHGCPLKEHSWNESSVHMKFKGNPDLETILQPLPRAKEYASFVYNLLKLDWKGDLNIEDFVVILKRALLIEGDGVELISPISNSLYKAYSDIDMDLKNILAMTNNMNIAGALILLMGLFSNALEFDKAISDYRKSCVDVDAIRTLIESKGDYALDDLNCRDGKKLVLIRHNTCGRRFWRDIEMFQANPVRCPVCEKSIRTAESFRNEFESEFGERYKLVSEYKGAHEKIDVVFKENGQRISDKPFLVMQRLRWLDANPEEYQRVLKSGVIRDRKFDREMLYQYILSTYEEDDLFLSASLPAIPDKSLLLFKLCNEGKLHTISYGVFSIKRTRATDDEIVDARYIYREGNHIGFDVGDRLLSVIDPSFQPSEDHRCIIVNASRLVSYHKKTVRVGSIECAIYRSDKEITEENWKTFAVLYLYHHRNLCSVELDSEWTKRIAVWAINNGITIENVVDEMQVFSPQTKHALKKLVKEMKRCLEAE